MGKKEVTFIQAARPMSVRATVTQLEWNTLRMLAFEQNRSTSDLLGEMIRDRITWKRGQK